MSDTTPEHTKRNRGRQHKDGVHPDILAAYAYVDSVCHTANLPGPAWYGWAIREAFLAGISHAAASPAADVAAAYARGIDEGVRLAKAHARMDVRIVDEGDGYQDDLSDIDWTDVDKAAAAAKGERDA